MFINALAWPDLVSVPQADGAPERDLAHQQVVHPAEAELQELHLLGLQVLEQRGCRTDND